MPIYAEKNMHYAHFGKICEKCSNHHIFTQNWHAWLTESIVSTARLTYRILVTNYDTVTELAH